MQEALSVAQLSAVIKHLLEDHIGDVVVSGEISNYKQHTSGHRYFTLKDAEAQISCVMWRTRPLPFIPEDGMRVVVGGRISVYTVQGKYQIDCGFIRPDGVGALYIALEKLKVALRAEGLFDEYRKRALPTIPMYIGVATSATGAAVQDILSTIQRRFPAATVIFRKTLVQGEGAAEDIVKAISDLNNTDAEVLIIGRGGGSIEDLWCFNTEIVARAIYHSRIPVISAVGHETDWTIADAVADKRAATPTAAAELVTPVTQSDMLAHLDLWRKRAYYTVSTTLAEVIEVAESFQNGSAARRIYERLRQREQRIDELTTRFSQAIFYNLTSTSQTLDHVTQLLKSLHPLSPLRKGYAVLEKDGVILNPNDNLLPSDVITIRRSTQLVEATVTTTSEIK